MDFRILGPLEVLEDGRTLDLGGAKQRALMTVLALHANRVVAQEQLIDALWDGEPPETARKALQVYVSQLRKLLGRERVETSGLGYLLRIEPDELDLVRFERFHDRDCCMRRCLCGGGRPWPSSRISGLPRPRSSV
jgi:DNA-binding SARP family transcriptional activator